MQGDGTRLNRRAVLAGLAAVSATPVLANAPERSVFPQPRLTRPDGGARLTARPVEALLAQAQLGGTTGFIALDAADGSVIEAANADTPLPPASVAKAPTALYALDRLGAGYRFTTHVLSTGSLDDGTLRGDLILQGGGDPNLQTADLVALAQTLVGRGLRRITGRFLTDDTALPHLREIAADQPPQAGYNPALSGLNLNFNRVHFVWQPQGGQMRLSLDARSGTEIPPVSVIEIEARNRAHPVYTYSDTAAREAWTVAAGALGGGGSRWLPVRRPGIYAGDVLRALLATRGCTLPPPQPAPTRQTGAVLASHRSAPLSAMMRDMLRFSTNITGECSGLTASRADGPAVTTLQASGQHMSNWLRQRHGATGLQFVDHSGLGDSSRVTARAMAAFLLSAHREGILPPLLRQHVMRDAQGRELPNHPISVQAKTGTLNFVSGLGGYAMPPGGRTIVFAIFSADLARRNAIPVDQRERPPAAPPWARRARALQQGLVERWSALHAS